MASYPSSSSTAYGPSLVAVTISVSGDIKLGHLPSVESRHGFEHVTLDAIEPLKLGMFFEMKGPPNVYGETIASLLYFKYGRNSNAGAGGCGTAFLYDDDGDMTEESWEIVRKFMQKKENNRGNNQAKHQKCMDRNIRRLRKLAATYKCMNCDQHDGISIADGKSTNLPRHLMCGACKVARYCSTDCQKKHWKQHKVVCKSTDKKEA